MYVRIEDGVYENSNPYFIEDNKLYMGWDYPSDIEADFLGDIIKQSDTIEELCDNFVIEFSSDGVNQIIYPEFQWAKKEFLSNKKGTLYGAIRVAGKGLIYVAKLNEKGELELI